MSPEYETVSSHNFNLIILTHVISGIHYSVAVPETVTSYNEAAELRAKSILKLIHEPHGESWLSSECIEQEAE